VRRWTLLAVPVVLLSADLVRAHRTGLSTVVGTSGLLAVLAGALWARWHRSG